MDKQISEIDKLTIRISKDPKSKLFVPLAEEYRKEGDIEMAVHVLSEGIKNNPSYVTARSVLGKLLLEKGDLLGSQKEFEEVVKAIPDNLMAQRKLGDIYVLQNRPDEALNHYKIVFSANPRDKELASLISDLEAGRAGGVRPLQSKVPPSPDKTVRQGTQAAVMQNAELQPPVTPMTAPATQAGDSTAATLKTPKTAPIIKSTAEGSAASIFTETTPATLSPAMEEEEPEEVLTVEPLETISPETESLAAGFAFPAEEHPSITVIDELIADVETTAEDSLFADTMPAATDSVEAEIIEAEIVEDAFDTVPDRTREEVTQRSFSPEEVAGEAPVVTSGKSDDFTTDTLAELYIAQGFYEKAIDIYQRMVADKPNSRGLKDKLERVRAMAMDTQAEDSKAVSPAKTLGSARTQSGLFSGADQEATGVTAKQEHSEEPREYVPPVDDEEPAINADIFAEPAEEKEVNNFFAEAREYQPAVDREGQTTAESLTEFDIFASSPAQDRAQEKPVRADFEAREYVPPKTEAASLESKAERIFVAPKPSKADKKETIDRLETWLRTIKKET